MRKLLAVFTMLLLAACAGPGRQPDAPETHPYFASAGPATSTEAPPPEVKPENCAVHVYRNRTAFAALNPAGPYVYVDGERFAVLRVGESLCLQLAPGKHNISIREAVMFVPGPVSGSLDVDVAQSKPVFVRYSKGIAGARRIGTNVFFKEDNELQSATEGQWRERE